MTAETRIKARWRASFWEVSRRCGVQPGDACAVLSATQSRALLVQSSKLAPAQAWGDAAACAVSPVGWGLNRRARWGAMSFCDKGGSFRPALARP